MQTVFYFYIFFQNTDESSSDIESVGSQEPARKRARTSAEGAESEPEDTIPFEAVEYKSIDMSLQLG